MKTALVQIGNSRGIRIPTEFLEQCQLQNVVELEVHGDHLIVRPTTQPRSGWDDAFRDMRNTRTTPYSMKRLGLLPNGTPRSGNGSCTFRCLPGAARSCTRARDSENAPLCRNIAG